MVNMNGRNTNGRNINADGNNRGCGCRKDNTRAMLLRHVQMHGFAMIEAGLYLDGHPLTIASQTDCDAWKWVQGPWPWESEAN